MKFEIIVVENSKETKLVLEGDKKIILGRSSSCDIKLSDSKISGKHCELSLVNNEVRILDLDTTNGTKLNDEEISEALIDPEDKVFIGAVQIKVQHNEGTGTQTHVSSLQEKMKRRILKKGRDLAKSKNSHREEVYTGTGVFVDRKFELDEESGNTKLIQLDKPPKEKKEKVIRKVAPREETRVLDKFKNFFTKSSQENTDENEE